jgi:predicted nucleic acid-binding protein
VGVALDTNILVYSEGLNDPTRKVTADHAIAQHHLRDVYIPAQVLAEFFAVQVRKFHMPPAAARANLNRWIDACPVVSTTPDILIDATALVAMHRIALWDAIVFASAVAADCDTLLSEDFQSGFTWRGVTVHNPFASAG